jgi:predicted membrane-bound spermidine synthase
MSRTAVESADEDGVHLVLYAREEHYEIEADGRPIASTDRRQAEQALAELALAPWQGRDDLSVLIGGLGAGHLLREVLARPGVVRVDVVEISPAVIDWERRFLSAQNGGAGADARVRVHRGELGAFVQAAAQPSFAAAPEDGWSILILDTDEYPASVSRPGNRAFYDDAGLAAFGGPLRGGGVLALWTTEKDDALLKRVHRGYQAVTRIGAGGDQGLVYVIRGRRGPRRAS